ncbi:MAG: hypothetical protein ACI81T_004631 [Bacteroidia bacterium]|jgi:hypothetical protein
MKKLYSKFILCAFAFSLFSCSQSTEKVENTDEATKEEMMKKEEEASKKREEHGYHNFDKVFQKLTTSYDGVMRSVDMFASKEEVKASEESAKMFTFEGADGKIPLATLEEETDTMLKYKLQMNEKDDAVIQYIFNDEGKLNAIKMTIHVADLVEYEAMEEDFILYFNHKHGLPTLFDDKKEVWKVKGSDVHEVDIIDKRDGDKYFLEVDIS